MMQPGIHDDKYDNVYSYRNARKKTYYIVEKKERIYDTGCPDVSQYSLFL